MITLHIPCPTVASGRHSEPGLRPVHPLAKEEREEDVTRFLDRSISKISTDESFCSAEGSSKP